MERKEYYNLPIEEVIQIFKSNAELGLNSAEVSNRHNEYGKNSLETEQETSLVKIFLKQFIDPITLLLLGASILSIFLGDWIDAAIIFSIVILSSLLSFWQEYNASQAMKSLSGLIQSHITVIRNQKEQEIDTVDIVPGDIVVLHTGDIIPADGRFIKTNNLTVNESSLTGESFSVEKNTDPLKIDTPLAKRSNSGFMGTNVVSGTGQLVITQIGTQTYFGNISRDLSKSQPTTEFRRGLNRFGKLLMFISAIMICLIFLLNILMHKHLYDSFMFAISLAVGITPQLLPAISSVNLSTGAKRMAEKDVIIKQLEVIDNIGGMDILCSDKTGTITQGGVSIDGVYDLSKQKSDDLLLLAQDNATYSTSNNNSIDQALSKLSLDNKKSGRLIKEKVYNFNDKVSSVAIEYNEKRFLDHQRLVIMKGAVKNVLGYCKHALSTDSKVVNLSEKIDEINVMTDELSQKGFRCLALAVKDFDEGEDVEFNENMVFAGLITMFDPLKEDSLSVIQDLRNLNVDLKIITGDSELVAKYLANELNMTSNQVISFADLQQFSPEKQRKIVENINIFAEVEPEGKKSIIQMLKSNGHLVGYMGDGINDVPPLHEADVAISVDDATDVAKDAANIVLLKSELRVVVDAIKEGRKVFANTMKYIFIAISANFGNMFSMAGASVLLKFLPLLPKQILMTNLLQDLPSMMLASDNVDSEWICTPHRFNFKFIIQFMIVFGLISSIFDYLMFAILIFHLNADETLFQTAWFTESVISAILLMLVLRTSKVAFDSRPNVSLIYVSLAVILLTASLSYLPFNQLLGFIPLPLTIWGIIFGVIITYLVVGEISKKIFYRYHKI